MTRVLTFGDLHLGAGRDHRVNALADQEATLNAIADLAVDRGVALILNAGDTFDRPRPPIEAQHIWQRFVRRLERLQIPMVTILGNAGHDQVNAAAETAAELYDGPLHRVSRHPEVIELAGVSVCTLPSVPVHRLVADHPDADRADVNELAARLLIQTAGELRAQAVGAALLLGHWSVDNAVLPNGMSVADLHEPVLPIVALDALGYQACVFGHIHKAQLMAKRSLYVGSPLCLNFGEAAVDHGCWILDIGNPEFVEGLVNGEFAPLAGRRFITVDVDLTDADAAFELTGESVRQQDIFSTDTRVALDESDLLAAAIVAQGNGELRDAVVRVRYRATEEQHRRVDEPALLRLLYTYGVHRVYGGLQWLPVRATRARAEGVDETLDPAAAVTAWCRANAVSDEDELRLLELTSRYLAAVPA